MYYYHMCIYIYIYVFAKQSLAVEKNDFTASLTSCLLIYPLCVCVCAWVRGQIESARIPNGNAHTHIHCLSNLPPLPSPLSPSLALPFSHHPPSFSQTHTCA